MSGKLASTSRAVHQKSIPVKPKAHWLFLRAFLIGILGLTLSCGFSKGPSAAPASLSIYPSRAIVTSHTTQQFSVTLGNPNNITWSASAGTITSRGLFTAPSVTANAEVTITATDFSNFSVQSSATVTVYPASGPAPAPTPAPVPVPTPVPAPTTGPSPALAPLSFLNPALPAATSGQPFSVSMSVSGGRLPYAWSLASGTLPTGFQLNSSSGLLTGTTSNTGNFLFDVSVTDASGQTTTDSRTLTVNPAGTSAFVPANFFGMHVAVHSTSLHNPARWGTPILGPIVIGAMGKCVVSNWSYVESAPGDYDWVQIDACTNWAAHYGIKYFQSAHYLTPASVGATDPATDSRCWLSAVPGTYFCQGTMTAAGEQQWINFNAAMALRYKGNPGMDFYEGWNEPPYAGNATAPALTAAQLAQYERDRVTAIRANDPNAKVASPAFIIDPDYPSYAAFLDDFLGNNPPTYDFYDIHINYPNAPEDEIPMIAQFKQILVKHGIVSPTIYATEAGRGGSGIGANADTCPGWPANVTLDLQQAFIGRMELLYWSQGVERHYWYAYDTCGTLTEQPASNSLNLAGIAYGNIEAWMIGATMTQGCAGPAYPTTGVWTCGLTESDGTRTLAVWDSSQSCGPTGCTTSSYSYDPAYTKYYTLVNGTAAPLSGGTVRIGAKPILLSQ